MKTRAGSYSLVIVTIFLICMVLACGGTSSIDACVGTVVFQGKTFDGRASTSEEAKSNACNNYCRDGDSEFDSRYRIWLDSPKGKAAGSPSKQESIFKDPDLMTYVTDTCSKRCVADLKPISSCK